MVERDGLVAGRLQALVDDVEHLEEGHVGTDVRRLIADHPSGRGDAGLSPDVEGNSHL
jgi:hypothetical protein